MMTTGSPSPGAKPGDRAPRAPSALTPPSPATAGPAPLAKRPPPLILIADDDPAIRDVWSTALHQAGFRTTTARDGGEALDRLRMLVPDLMILDLRMPELSGTALLELVRTRPALARIPVLIISGFLAEEPGLERGLHIVGRLPKPQTLQAVVDAVRTGLTMRPRT